MLHVMEHPDGTLSDGQMTPGNEPIGQSYRDAAAAMGCTVVALPGLDMPNGNLRLMRLTPDRKGLEGHPDAIAADVARRDLQEKIALESRRLALVSLQETAEGAELSTITAELAKLER